MISNALMLDVLVVLICVYFLARHAQLRFSHPAIIYLVFHLFVVTWRLYSINAGSPTLFDGPTWYAFGLESITYQEIARAAFMADLALAATLLGSILAKVHFKRQQSSGTFSKIRTLSKHNILLVAVPAFIVGLIGLYIDAPWLPIARPEISLGDWETSSWIGITQFWPVLVMLSLVYWYGFRPPLLIALIPLILLLSLQGTKRFRIVSAIIFLVQVYLDRSGRKWPTIIVTVLLIIGAATFFSLKRIGQLVQNGAPFEALVQTVSISVGAATSGSGDGQLLDMFAGRVTMVDRGGKFYYGSIYLYLVTLPIPRQLWPDKPANTFGVELSSETRPFARFGMTATAWGEYYLNFGYFGLILCPLLLAYLLSRLYFFAYQRPYYSVARFAYFLFVTNLFTIYRDGWRSLVLFVLVNMLPLSIMVALHYFRPSDEVLANRLVNNQPIRLSRYSARYARIERLLTKNDQEHH